VTAATLVILSFLLFRPDSDAIDAAEEGTVTARSCAAAEALLRSGLQPGQDIIIHGCAPATAEVASR